jgi:hypothetical protein
MKTFTSCLLLLWAALLCLAPLTPVEAATKKKAPKTEQSAYDLPMRFVIVRNSVPGCEPLCPQWISAEGQIMAKTPALFKKALAKAGDLRLPIVVTSPGGDVDAALAMGKMIRERHLDVLVGWTYFADCEPHRKDCKLPKEQKNIHRGIAMSYRGYCVSACAFILAAGEQRLAGDAAFVGVHQISRTMIREQVRYLEKYRIVNGRKKMTSRKIVSRKPMKSYVSTKLDKKLKKKIVTYFAGMGVEAKLLDLFDKAPPSSMYMLTPQEARTTKLVTGPTLAFDLVTASQCKIAPPAASCVPLEQRTAQP